ncbi:MAG: phosphoketolase family protein [Cyanobacteria bacterium P01_C01_bin.89]
MVIAFSKDSKNLNLSVLNEKELGNIDAYWRACNYLAVGMIYLRDNPLLKESLQASHIKHRLLGHWGSSPALSFTYIHCNQLIKKYDLDMIFMAGPGHGAPGVLGPVYLEGTYSEIYPDKSEDEEGMQRFFKQFSFPGFIGSHVTPETPGSIHEGGELGYSVSHAYGAVLDNPDLIVTCVVGDGEAETGPLATSWHSNKFINPARDGAVLPVLNLNGYKIANPTILARISQEELEALFRGYGYTPYFVEGNDPLEMHRKMAATMEECVGKIREVQRQALEGGTVERPRWPMIVLRTPKGWTGPQEVDGKKVEDFWRSHQVPMGGMHENSEHVRLLEEWMRGYQPEELFDENGTLVPELKALAPTGNRRMGSNPHANGGLLRKALKMPDFRELAIDVGDQRGTVEFENTKALGIFMREIMRDNPNNFRLMGPDETASNRLQDVYDVTEKVWMADIYPEDAGGTQISQTGRVMEMLSEHTLQGWLETYLLTGRHGLFHTYEAFAHVVDSMFNQHAKWLDICKNHVPWRRSVSSLNILLSSLVWRQDHNGFSHQDPGYIDLVTNKNPDVVRLYFPPDANCLLSVADHCFRSTDYINVIISDKQNHLQYLPIDEAIAHCTKGVGIWDWASNDEADDLEGPDVIMACCGDIPTMESLAATAILREEIPSLKVRFVNVVDLFKLVSEGEHPHGLSDRDFNSLFTADKPVIFNFHGYPWLIHKMIYRRSKQERVHVRGYKEKGNINTPLELAILNEIDRFSLVIDVIDRVPQLGAKAGHIKERMKNKIIEALAHAHEHGRDKDNDRNWTWPFPTS